MNQHEFFYDVAKAGAKQVTCLRRRFFCIIVNPMTRQIISTGYNGSPRGKEHCTDSKWCIREELNVPPGERYECCKSVHDLQNALIQAGRDAWGCIAYLYGEDVKTNYPIVAKPCFLCTKMAINAGVTKAIIKVNNSFVELDLNELYDKYVIEMVEKYYPEDKQNL